MAQQMITLEEAAERLGISPEEMKKRLKTDPEFKKLSQIRDGSTVRFKVSAIDELGRQLGLASEDGLPLAMQELDPPGSDDFKVKVPDRSPKKSADDDLPLDLGNADDEVFSLTEEPKPAPPKSGKIAPKAPKNMSDSSHGSSDSDVRLDSGKIKKVKAPEPKSDEAAIPTEEIALDFGGPGSAVIKGGSSAKLSAPKSGNSSGKLDPSKSKAGKSGKPPVENDSSEFELSLDADSDDFDLQMNPDADEVDLGSLPKGKSGSDKRSSASGINLSDPADSGISLEKNKKKVEEDSDESDVDFELSLDSSAVSSSTKLGAPKSGKLVLDSDSDSEFELTLDDSGGSLEQAALESEALAEEDKGDIFETDFEIPSMPDESGSEAVALESDTDLEKSDFELEMADSDVAEVSGEESGSEVVLLEDEEEARPKAKGKPQAKGKKRPVVEDDADVDLADDSATDESDASVSKALRGAKSGRRGSSDSVDEEFVATKPWGIVPVLFLAPALLFTLVGALMGFELLQTTLGYQQPRKPAAPIVRGLATQLDMELRDQ
ncbi:unnamed protein product [Gemmata massiliana]|uniref:Uncharacterized protein n=1 Tax=Gemmata massiliana TaxID=1210884 RepID=A0A6P2D598_9BACT|nr:hypothetical protein [Gemmata massiliana]VTR96471.1 unnamed protein product [Gemmata massiliana]